MRPPSAQLGLLLHWTGLAARYLAAPLLHEARFRGSSSALWPRAGLGAQPGAPPPPELPLFAAAPSAPDDPAPGPQPAGGRGGGGAGAVATLARGLGRLLARAPPPTTLASADGAASGPPSARTSPAPSPGCAHGEAVRLLRRSVACVCAHELGSQGAAVPPAWGAFALLAALAAGLARPHHAAGGGGGGGDAGAAQARAGGERGGAGRAAGGGAAEEGEELEGCDDAGWELVAGALPPPPSDEAELLLYERVALPR